MDDQLKGQIRELAQQLLASQKRTYRTARTLLEIKTLTTEIGDELTRQLANSDLAQQFDEASQITARFCPQCGQKCAV